MALVRVFYPSEQTVRHAPVHMLSHGLCQCRTKSSRACSRVGNTDCVRWTCRDVPSITCHCLPSSCKIHSLRLCGSSMAIRSASSKSIKQRSLTEDSGIRHSPRTDCPVLDTLPSPLCLVYACCACSAFLWKRKANIPRGSRTGGDTHHKWPVRLVT
jgi:hypothetical protein